MVLDSLVARMGGRSQLSPMQIAHHTLFTAREKIDLLNKLKAEASGSTANEDGVGYSPEEIDEAIAEVRMGTQNGEPAATVLGGDN